MTFLSQRKAGEVGQGVSESRPYGFDFTTLAERYGTPTTVAYCILYDETSGEDVSASKLAGSTNLINAVGTTKRATSILRDHEYTLVLGLNFPNSVVLDAYITIYGQR